MSEQAKTAVETLTEAKSAVAKKSSLAHRLYVGEMSYDFIGKRKFWFRLSIAIVLVSLLLVGIRGLNLSIDFKGGTAFTIPTPVTATSVDDFRRAVQSSGIPEMAEVNVNTVGTTQVRVETRSLNAEELGKMRIALAQQAKVEPSAVANSLIGASWGKQITQQGLIALVVFIALVSLLIGFYFRNWKMSVAAIVALIHDLILTIGVFAAVHFAFSPSTLIGLLTILGYSLYDTVVVFDKVRENVTDIEKQDRTFGEATNAAINQVLVRSINTTIIGVLPVAALLFAGVFILGTGPLKDLGLALFVGMIAGAYSSVFIAAPLFSFWKDREPAIMDHNKQVVRRRARRQKAKEEPQLVETVPADVETIAVLSAAELALRRPSGPRKQPSKSSRAGRKH